MQVAKKRHFNGPARAAIQHLYVVNKETCVDKVLAMASLNVSPWEGGGLISFFTIKIGFCAHSFDLFNHGAPVFSTAD